MTTTTKFKPSTRNPVVGKCKAFRLYSAGSNFFEPGGDDDGPEDGNTYPTALSDRRGLRTKTKAECEMAWDILYSGVLKNAENPGNAKITRSDLICAQLDNPTAGYQSFSEACPSPAAFSCMERTMPRRAYYWETNKDDWGLFIKSEDVCADVWHHLYEGIGDLGHYGKPTLLCISPKLGKPGADECPDGYEGVMDYQCLAANKALVHHSLGAQGQSGDVAPGQCKKSVK